MSSPEPPVSTRDRILDAAEILFAERGLAGTAVRDIAGKVGLNPASLYNHFPSKLALYEAVLERSVKPLLEVLQAAAKADNPAQGDIQFVDVVMNHLEHTPHLARLIHHEAVTGGVHLARLARVWMMNPSERIRVQRLFDRSDAIAVSIRDADVVVEGNRASLAFDQRFVVSGQRSGSGSPQRALRRALAARDSLGTWALEDVAGAP